MKSFKLISFTTFFILLVITSSLADDDDKKSTADKVEGTPISVMRVGSDTFGDPIFQKGLQN